MLNTLPRIVIRVTVGPYIAKLSPLELMEVIQEVPKLTLSTKRVFPIR